MSHAGAACRQVAACRICGSPRLWRVLSLGTTPLANAFVSRERLDAPEPLFPLELVRCDECGLAQLSVVVDPEVMFRHYLYASSASPPLHEHFEAYAADLVGRYAPSGSLVVEIGSNDGVLLAPLRRRGVRAVGVEPSANLARTANALGLETWNDFFGTDVARRVRGARGAAKAVVANNVLAHIDDLGEVLASLDVLLADDGVFVAEFPYALDLLEKVEYDTIYHEHLSYFTLAPLRRLFARASFEAIDVDRIPIHGGSLRLVVARAGRRPLSPSVAALEEAETAAGLDGRDTYTRFADRVAGSRRALLEMLTSEQRRGARIAALGATAKGNTLLNYCGIGPDLIEYIADSTPLKQGLYSPGMHIPVRPDSILAVDCPDRTLLLAWNYAAAVLDRYRSYVDAGGRFIHPIPLARFIP